LRRSHPRQDTAARRVLGNNSNSLRPDSLTREPERKAKGEGSLGRTRSHTCDDLSSGSAGAGARSPKGRNASSTTIPNALAGKVKFLTGLFPSTTNENYRRPIVARASARGCS